MPNIFSLICICLNSALHSSSFSSPNCLRLMLFQSNHRCYASHTCVLFLLALVWQAAASFR